MTRKPKLASSLLLASILGLIAAPVLAGPHECGPQGADYRAERMQQHQQKLHDLLKLTAEQETAWKKLTASESAMSRPAPETAADWAKLTTPERGEKRLAHMKADQVLMGDHVAAIKEFYAALTPEQKVIFDDFHAAPHKHMSGKPLHLAPAAEKPAP